MIKNRAAYFTDDAIPYTVQVQADSAEVVRLVDDGDIVQRAGFRWTITDKTAQLHMVAGKQDRGIRALDPANTDAYIAETRLYYAALLAGVEMSTPDPLVDAAFVAAVVGMDYTYSAPGWLEGLTGWATYFCDNYQISAAVALRQDVTAREALRFFALHPEGPGWTLTSDGGLLKLEGHRDNLLYLILELSHYWAATRDLATLTEVWMPFCRALDDFIEMRNADSDGLLDFRMGCNSFLYQADHLSLPGAAFSPP